MSPGLAARAHSVLRTRWARAFLWASIGAAVIFSPVPMCPVRLQLHQPCPGCGVSRAIVLALEGHLHESLAMHPLALGAVALLAPTFYFIVRREAPAGGALDLPRPLRIAWGIYVALLVVLWIARFLGHFGGPVPV